MLSRIQRRYRTATDRVSFGPISFAFTRVAEPNRVLDEVAEEEDRREKCDGVRHAEPLHLPYWAELWDSGGGVCQHLVDQWGSRLRGASVLDLGCGQGMVGCVAAALGAKVLFADLEPPALLFARLNGVPFEHIRARRVNWQSDDLGERFDVIIGADILYERSQWVFLSPFWKRHLKGRGTVMLGEPGRPTGDGFIEWIGGQGWALRQFVQPVETRERPIRVLELRDKSE